MKIVVSGGGSGGHITPLLAVCTALKSRGNQIHYVGLGQPRERELVEPTGVEMHKIASGKLRRYHGMSWWQKLVDVKTIALNVLDGFRLLVGVVQGIWLLLRLRPDRIFIKGGYVGLPVGIAAWFLRKPFIIHESDATPGLTNRLLARLTPYRLSGFDIPGFVNLGNPVRPEILELAALERSYFGISSDKPIVLAVGGSLGAAEINLAVLDLAHQTDRYEIIHITGDDKNSDFDRSYYHQYPFLAREMAAALQLADVVVSRAGANTLAELAALGKASIIVPHPNLSGNHQVLNAKAMADNGAIVLLPQSELDAARLETEVAYIVEDSEFRLSLEQGIGEFANPNAAEDIAKVVISNEVGKTRGRDGEN